MGIQERIKEIELELSRTQKNKATTTHIGLVSVSLFDEMVRSIARC
jgi:ribosome-interacting GTPase 1